MKRFFIYTFFALLIAGPSWSADNFTTSLWIDSSSSASIEEVIISNRFEKVERNNFFNPFTNSTYWLKITPDSAFSSASRILFSNSYNHYESIYFDYGSGRVKKQNFGTFQKSESNTFLPSFELDAKIKAIFVSIKSDTFLYESFHIESEKTVYKSINKLFFFYVLFLGFLLFISAYILLLYLKSKRIILRSYLLYLLSLICMFLFISNLGSYLIWPDLKFSPSYLEGSFSFFTVWSYLELSIRVTKIGSYVPILKKIARLFLFSSLLVQLVIIVGFHPRYLSLTSNFLPLIALIFLIIFSIISLKNKNKHAGIYLFGIISFICGMSVRIFINWGIIPYSMTTDLFVYAGLFIELLLFTFVVITHIEKNIKEYANTQLELIEKSNRINALENDVAQLSVQNKEYDNLDDEAFGLQLNEKLHTELTAREIEVLRALIEGGTQKEIADKLFISLSTLKTHISRVYSKLDSQNRIEAINKAKNLLK
ncbi:MAG: 7TM diverse intracellular signaling domain-containing protein [Crocinitomicaceae bacterium]